MAFANGTRWLLSGILRDHTVCRSIPAPLQSRYGTDRKKNTHSGKHRGRTRHTAFLSCETADKFYKRELPE